MITSTLDRLKDALQRIEDLEATNRDLRLKIAKLETKGYKPPLEKKDRIEEMLEEVLESMHPTNGTYDFALSLQEGFKKYGKLTPKQEQALERIHERI